MNGNAPGRFDADPSAYAEYLRTPLGRLRSELSWRNLEPHLPRPGTPPPRALDLGAGTGEMALRLAASGWSVTLVDGSRRMLERTTEIAEARGLVERIACHALDLDAGGIASVLGGGSYDLVLCHHLLEYVASPEALLGEARAALAAEGRVSIVVRNLAGEMMKRLLREGGPEIALELLAARRVREEMYGLDVRLFEPDEIGNLLGGAGFAVVAEYGVRVAADHVADWTAGEDGFHRMLELERRLGEIREFRPLARYVQVIAARAQASAGR